ncbi:hypothetical protein [Pannonibacter phragmitetus]|uniref:PglD-related sugar-binding protein n=1 Tax=Pannonibacter phragmitetus TaxID=121719 RepID=UPI003D2F1364
MRIIGAGGHGRVLADIAEAMGYSDIAFLDAAYPDCAQGSIWDVMGKPEALGTEDYALGIGNNQTRLRLLETQTRAPVTLIHPSAIISPMPKSVPVQ